MYKCHLCDLKTNQLNGLLSKHYKIHCNESYSKEQYKTDILNNNGRLQKSCKICNLPTTIPKGESDYPDYHKKCYVKNKLQGNHNPNYQNKHKDSKCTNCNTDVKKYDSQVLGKHFCSISCSTQHYNIPENQSEAKKQAIVIQKDTLRKLVKTPEFKMKSINSMLKNKNMRSSQIEKDFFNHIKLLHPDAINGYQIEFYTVDIWIPSLQVAIDVQGNYWHNLPETKIRDKRKYNYFKNNKKDIKFYVIWESEIRDKFTAYNKPYDITILCGASGSGKSWIGKQLESNYYIIDYDKIKDVNNILLEAQTVTSKPKLLITPMRASWLAKQLRLIGMRVNIIAIIEDTLIIEQRLQLRKSTITDGVKSRIIRYNNIKNKICQYYGSQQQILEYLTNQSHKIN